MEPTYLVYFKPFIVLTIMDRLLSAEQLFTNDQKYLTTHLNGVSASSVDNCNSLALNQQLSPSVSDLENDNKC